jgi:hypothetical protein
MSAENDKMPTKMILEEGQITLRALQPAEVEQLRKIEAANQADPLRSLARYMPLIQVAAITVEPRAGAKIPSDLTPLDYVLSAEDNSDLWLIVRELYDLSGVPWTESIQTASAEAAARVRAGGVA